jgi:hypothetical protein
MDLMKRGAKQATGLQQCFGSSESHAEWPKDIHEYASTETGRVTCWPLTAVGIEGAPPRATRLAQREKKL